MWWICRALRGEAQSLDICSWPTYDITLHAAFHVVERAHWNKEPMTLTLTDCRAAGPRDRFLSVHDARPTSIKTGGVRPAETEC